MAPAFAGFKLKSTGRLDALKAGGGGDILKSPSCPPSFFNGAVELKDDNGNNENKRPSYAGASFKLKSANNAEEQDVPKTAKREVVPPVVQVEPSAAKPKPTTKITPSVQIEVTSAPAERKAPRVAPVVQVESVREESTPTPTVTPTVRPSIQIQVTSTSTAKKAPPRHSKSLPVVRNSTTKKSPPERKGSHIIVVVETNDQAQEAVEYEVGEAAPKKEKLHDENRVPDLDEDELRKLNKKNKLVGGSLITGLTSCIRCDSDRTHSKPVTVNRQGKDYAAHLIQCLDCGRQFHV